MAFQALPQQLTTAAFSRVGITGADLNRIRSENIFEESPDAQVGGPTKVEEGPIETVEDKQEINEIISKQAETNAMVRDIKQTRISMTNEFHLPDDRETYSFVNLVKLSNVNYKNAQNLFGDQ